MLENSEIRTFDRISNNRFYDLTVEINTGFRNDLWIGQPSGKESLFFKALQLN
jgi:hypothetical protein